MKKRIISMLLAGMMVLNSAVVYADTDITSDYTTYAEEVESGSESGVAVQSETADETEFADGNEDLSVNEASEQETDDEITFTDGDTDEVEITEENPTDVSSQDETDESSEIEFAEEADDIFSENEVAVQAGGTITASGTLATGVNWSLSDVGNLQFSGSGAIEKDNGQDYPWDMAQVHTVTIQSGITEIGSGAFADGANLTKVSISADSLQTVSADAFENCSNAAVDLYYSGNAPTAIPAFTGTAKVSVYYKEADATWTDAFKATYADVTWEPCCTINGTTANTNHTYVRTNDEIQIQTDGKNYPTKENTAYYEVTCSVCGNVGKDYNNCINCIDTTDLHSDHPYNTETTTDWTVYMEGAEEIILTFDEKTKFETNYDDFFYIYKEDGELYQKFINDQLAGKTVIVPGSSVTLRLTTDYSADDWGFAVTKAYGTTHKWDAGVITKPAERDQTGTMKKTCQKCGEVVEEVIPAPYLVCGDDANIFWGITPDHVLELSVGTGSSENMGYSDQEALDGHRITTAPWGEYEGIIEGVRVKEGISRIMQNSFYGLTKLKWAEIEDSVTNIGYSAFQGCTALKRVKLSENLKSIDNSAFEYCGVLEEISIPESVTTIEWEAFGSCASLKSINIPRNLNKCATLAFEGCYNLRALYIEDLSQWLNMEEWPSFSTAAFNYTTTSIDYYVGGKALENLVIPQDVTRIRKEAFVHGHNIKTVAFHEKIEHIDQEAFSDCVNLELTNDKLPNYLKSIGNDAFQNCKKISKIGIPSSVVNIGNDAFRNCSGLKQCIFAEDIQIDKISAATFSGCENLKSIEIPLSVTTIEENAFSGCHALKSVRIPAGVTSINRCAFDLHAENMENPAEFTFLGDFGDFNSMFDMDENGARTITYYACNSTWNSSDAQGFLNGFPNTTLNPIHMSDDYTVITPATCTTDGEKSFTCDNCGNSFTYVIPATGHKLTLQEHKDATCIEKGYDIQVCSVCKETFKTELDIDPNAHQYGEGEVIKPNCSREGYTLYTCALCGNTKREDYKTSTDHDYEDIVVPATCQTQGYTRHQCKNCGYFYDDTWTEPLEHDYEATVTKPTCTERGYTYYSCKNCGYSYRDNFVGALGHKYTKEVIKPTCIDEGYTRNTCSLCGLTYNSNYREATGHDYEAVVTAPTCTERGYTTYTCKNENCDNIVVSDYRSALGHSYEAVTTDSTCTEKGFTTYTCVTCRNSYKGDETDLAPHKWDETITKQSTYLESGLKVFKCLNCGETYTEDIPALVQTDLGDCTITLSYRKTVYNGKEKTPKVTVKNSNGIVNEDEYSVAYADNLNAGNAEVIVTAKSGNVSITGEATIPFTIAKAKQSITAETESESIHVNTEEPVTINGLGEVSIVSENEDIATVTEEKMILGKKKGITYLRISAAGDDNHEAAETRIQISVDEDHILKMTDTVWPTYKESGKVTSVCELCGETYTEEIPALGQTALKDCTITLAYQQTVYDGKEKTPEVIVKNDNGVVSKDNYTVAYANNTNAGEATVTITAKEGDICITGEVEKTFVISRAKQSVGASCKANQIHVKESTVIETNGIGKISLSTENEDLINIDGMQITGKAAGLALVTVTASGDDNHEPASTTVAVGVDENHIIQQVIENKTTLANGDVQYEEVQRCTLCGDDIKRTTKTLKNLNSKDCEIRLASAVYVFEGKEIKPTVSVSMSGTLLKEGKDYSLSYKDNNRTGKAKVCVTGIGNYTNTKEATFEIIKLNTPTVTSIVNVRKGMKLSWRKVSEAQGYIVYRAYGNGGYKAIKTITNSSILTYTDTGATVNGGKYTYAVCAYRGNAKSSYVGKTYYYLNQNRISSVKNNASRKVTVKWTRNAKATGYQINYKTGKTQKTITVKSNKTLNRVLKSLKKKATYSVKVRSYKTVSRVNYYSEWSPAKNVKIRK